MEEEKNIVKNVSSSKLCTTIGSCKLPDLNTQYYKLLFKACYMLLFCALAALANIDKMKLI